MRVLRRKESVPVGATWNAECPHGARASVYLVHVYEHIEKWAADFKGAGHMGITKHAEGYSRREATANINWLFRLSCCRGMKAPRFKKEVTPAP